MEAREVTFKYYNKIKRKVITGKGSFHQYGSDVELADDKYFQITFAVVEDDNGEVHRIPEDGLHFQHPPEI